MNTERKSKRYRIGRDMNSVQAVLSSQFVIVHRFIPSGKRQPHMQLCFNVKLWPEHPADQHSFVMYLEKTMSRWVFDEIWDSAWARHADAICKAVNEVLA